MDSTVYIDESGDLGYGTGTRWFVISAVIVDKSNETKIRQRMNAIKTRINAQEIHLRRINDFYRRSYLVRELNEEDFTYINIIADTNKFDRSKIPTTAIAYNYMCRMLLERASWLLRDTHRTADIVLSARGTSRDGELIQYIKEKLIPYGGNQIVQGIFGNISAKTANSWDMLQLADVCATTTFLAYEINGWGFRTPCYFKTLQNHIYQHGGKIMKYGIKYFTDDMVPQAADINTDYPCKAKERTFGATST